MSFPDVGLFNVPRMDRSVDFPDPDSPMTATNSPASIVKLTSFRAETAASPFPYCFDMCCACIRFIIILL